MTIRVIFYVACLLVFTGPAWGQAQSEPTAGSAGAERFQFNAFYGETLSINPKSINAKISDLNTGASKTMPKISWNSLAGGEFLVRLSQKFRAGLRYTSQKADSKQGMENGAINQVMLDVDDLSATGKYSFKVWGFNFNAGATTGISLVNNLTVNDKGTQTRYVSPGGLVARGFTGVRMQLSVFALWGEFGYQYLEDKGYKDLQKFKPTSSAGEVTLSLTGPYVLGGVGIQF